MASRHPAAAVGAVLAAVLAVIGTVSIAIGASALGLGRDPAAGAVDGSAATLAMVTTTDTMSTGTTAPTESTSAPTDTSSPTSTSSPTHTPTSTPTPAGSPYPPPVAMPVNASGNNPLAGRSWGVYAGPYEQWYEPWLNSSGSNRTLLDQIALQPKSSWFGSWTPPDQIGHTISNYIEISQQGDPNVMVQLAIFDIPPWGPDGACAKGLSAAQQTSYRTWIDNAASAIGSTYAAIVVQPDSPFATQCAPKPKVALGEIRYATKAFAVLPNTSVYVETGAADWMHDDVANALKILIPGGVQYARGFAFNGTHYDATSRNVDFGAKVAKALARRGIPGKHFVINTAQNGAPFTGAQYGGNFPDNARVCRTTHPAKQHLCVTLGIPPTTDVADKRWGLTKHERRLAAKYADAYLWFGRPWLKDQSAPFLLSRALELVRTTPF